MSGIRHEGGVNWNLAVVRNVGTRGLMERERLKRWTRKSQSTEADPRGGMTCSSEAARIRRVEVPLVLEWREPYPRERG